MVGTGKGAGAGSSGSMRGAPALQYGGGTENPMVRADMIYYKTPNDGALFAPGSLSWCGSLSYDNYNNNVSKILENAIKGFLKEGPLP